MSISGAAVSAAKAALTIAIRYGLVRRQFSPPTATKRSFSWILEGREHIRVRLQLWQPIRREVAGSAVNSSCAKLRPHAGALVDAFGIPNEALAFPERIGSPAPASK